MQNFRENFLYVLKKRGMSQVDVANKLGLTKQSIQHYLTGRINLPTLYKIADALNTTPAALLSEIPLSELEAVPAANRQTITTLVCPSCGAELRLLAKAELKK